VDKIAGVVFSFRRPDYLIQTLESLEVAEESNDIDWYAFQDNAYNTISDSTYATEDEISSSLSLLKKSSLNFKEIQVNKYNECIARQKHKAHKLFDSYEKVFFFEDDLIVGKHYFRLLRIALTQFPNYAILMNSFPNKAGLNKLRNCKIARIWGYGMTERLFRKIEPDYKKFHAGISQVDYIKRNQVKGLMSKYNLDYRSHDICITRLTRLHGKGKLWSHVSRGYAIGKEGNLTFRNPIKWKKRNLDGQAKIITYKKDAKINQFIIT